MAQTAPLDVTSRPRRMRGFEPAAALMAPQMRRAAERRGFAVARLLTHWPEVAGPQVAAVARPLKITHAREGFGAVLTLLTTGVQAPWLAMELPRLRERVNACYGYNAVQRIVITQTGADGFAEGRPQFAPPAPRAPDPQAVAQARAVAALFDDAALSRAMERLALNHADRHSRISRKDLT